MNPEPDQYFILLSYPLILGIYLISRNTFLFVLSHLGEISVGKSRLERILNKNPKEGFEEKIAFEI